MKDLVHSELNSLHIKMLKYKFYFDVHLCSFPVCKVEWVYLKALCSLNMKHVVEYWCFLRNLSIKVKIWDPAKKEKDFWVSFWDILK